MPSAATQLLAQPELLAQLYAGIALLDGELRCVYATGELCGRSSEKLLGASFVELLPSDRRARFVDACTGARTRRTRCSFDYRVAEERITLHVLAVEDGRGTPLTVVVRPLPSECGERDDRLRYAVDASGVGTWSWDRTTDTVTWDERLCRIYGLPLSESPRVYGDYVRYLHPEDRPRIEAQIGRCLQTGVYEEWSGSEEVDSVLASHAAV